MANSKQAAKRNRQAEKRRLSNRSVMGSMRTAIKKARTAVDAKSGDASELIRAAVSRIDKAVSRKALKRQTASRLISRLTKRA